VAGPEVLLSRLPSKIGLYHVACFLGVFCPEKPVFSWRRAGL